MGRKMPGAMPRTSVWQPRSGAKITATLSAEERTAAAWGWSGAKITATLSAEEAHSSCLGLCECNTGIK